MIISRGEYLPTENFCGDISPTHVIQHGQRILGNCNFPKGRKYKSQFHMVPVF